MNLGDAAQFLPHPNQLMPQPKGSSTDCPKCHKKRRNASCRNNACAECCELIDQSAGCRPHTTQRNCKMKDGPYGDEGRKAKAKGPTATDNLDPALLPAPVPVARNGQTVDAQFTNRSGFRHFRDVNIQDQANERINNAAEETVNQTISILFWARKGQEVCHPLSYVTHTPDLWRVPAPSWPRFRLDQCSLLVQLAEATSGPLWDRTVRVWNDKEQSWALTAVTTMEKYPVEFRKVLVILPGTKRECCEDAQYHIDSVTTRSTKERTKLYQYITPTNPDYNVTFVNGSPTPIRINKGKNAPQNRILYLDNYTPSQSSQQAPEHDNEGIMEIEEDGLNMIQDAPHQEVAMDTDTAPPKSPLLDDQEGGSDTTPTPAPQPEATKPKWPEGVTMSDAKKMMDAMLPPLNLTSRQAWIRTFAHSHRAYSKTTVNNNLRWLNSVDADRLSAYISTNGPSSLIETQKVFNDEWKKIDTRRKNEQADKEPDNNQPNKKRRIDSME
ncbi:uncharacterized protein MELLADRAFT_111516 [Melampsora larici-populina 98AG31]|uniref:Uncharacterized protein n=1 Tax=Melampsora larici-populina (strain 98AG31 / pathotype 3-4-7) TaxID=747676 RepID=F4S3F9_MELLP|nr:uncharacterized protein MELLADRAFT_111516 [Melampsora larici-populina 98AG31]EGG00841.1 hypothetical protein MELLADRAFT_111516 [Melampsora larici-populina 98AG31]